MQYDSLAKLDQGLASNALRKELSIGPEPRLVLWTTQTHSWDQKEIDAGVESGRNVDVWNATGAA